MLFRSSFDRGASWVGPHAINSHRWRINPIIAVYNGPGLRDRGVLLADGSTIYFAYGDGRDGLSAAFGARIRVIPAPAPTPTPEPTPGTTPEATPSATPEATPGTTPSPTPDASPSPTPDASPSAAA